LLEKKVDPNGGNSLSHNRLFSEVTSTCKLNKAELLLPYMNDEEVNYNNYGHTPLSHVVACGNLPFLEKIIQRADVNDGYSIHLAMDMKREDLVMAFVESDKLDIYKDDIYESR
jgi:hypothetical protein